MIIQQEYRIKISDIGKENKITNKAILGILEDVACKHSDIAGYGVLNIPQTHLTWLLLEWKVQVIKRPGYGESIIAKTWSKESKKCYAFRDFEICDMKGNILIKAISKWVLMNVKDGKIQSISNEVIGSYEPELDKIVFDNEEFKKIKEPENYEKELLYKVRRADIDLNNHMHNLNYIELANEILPNSIYDNGELDNFRITYKKEIKLDDVVRCKYIYENGENIIIIKSKDDKILHAIIKLENK